MLIYYVLLVATIFTIFVDCSDDYSQGTIHVKESKTLGGIWKYKTQWKSHWERHWIVKKIWVPYWKKVWAPLETKEWIPISSTEEHLQKRTSSNVKRTRRF